MHEGTDFCSIHYNFNHETNIRMRFSFTISRKLTFVLAGLFTGTDEFQDFEETIT